MRHSLAMSQTCANFLHRKAGIGPEEVLEYCHIKAWNEIKVQFIFKDATSWMYHCVGMWKLQHILDPYYTDLRERKSACLKG